jgi:hypothetical protein
MKEKKRDISHSQARKMLEETRKKVEVVRLENGEHIIDPDIFTLVENVLKKIANEEATAYSLSEEKDTERELKSNIVWICFLLGVCIYEAVVLYTLQTTNEEELVKILEYLLVFTPLIGGFLFYSTLLLLTKITDETSFLSQELKNEVSNTIAILNSYMLGIKEVQQSDQPDLAETLQRRNSSYYQD